jgi:hypothetical protein
MPLYNCPPKHELDNPERVRQLIAADNTEALDHYSAEAVKENIMIKIMAIYEELSFIYNLFLLEALCRKNDFYEHKKQIATLIGDGYGNLAPHVAREHGSNVIRFQHRARTAAGNIRRYYLKCHKEGYRTATFFKSTKIPAEAYLCEYAEIEFKRIRTSGIELRKIKRRIDALVIAQATYTKFFDAMNFIR